MSSILTNNSAMVALQTLKGINSNLSKTQDEISTGKTVATARDNSAVWAISKVMESDVKGFKAISDSLSLGQSTITVARSASESVTDLLTEIKGKIVAAQEDNVDRSKIQTDIGALRDQINSVVNAAQFNGLNLLSNDSTTEGSGTVSILSSLDRDSAGNVTASDIDIRKQDLQTTAQSVDTAAGTYAAGGSVAAVTLNATQSQDLQISSVTAGTAYSLSIATTDTDGTFSSDPDAGGALADAADIAYVARDGDTGADVAAGLAAAYAAYASENGIDSADLALSANGDTLTVTSTLSDANDTIAVAVDTVTSNDNVIGGGLAALADIDVSTTAGADEALAAIEGLIQTSIDASAEFGSAQGRIDIQADFVGKLTDSLKAGIGTLVDADMEEASARLQALQVQQQLGIQSLSIANQQPQSILSLFR